MQCTIKKQKASFSLDIISSVRLCPQPSAPRRQHPAASRNNTTNTTNTTTTPTDNNNRTNKSNMDKLNDDIWCHVVSFIPTLRQIRLFSQTNKRAQELVHSSVATEPCFERFFRREFGSNDDIDYDDSSNDDDNDNVILSHQHSLTRVKQEDDGTSNYDNNNDDDNNNNNNNNTNAIGKNDFRRNSGALVNTTRNRKRNNRHLNGRGGREGLRSMHSLLLNHTKALPQKFGKVGILSKEDEASALSYDKSVQRMDLCFGYFGFASLFSDGPVAVWGDFDGVSFLPSLQEMYKDEAHKEKAQNVGQDNGRALTVVVKPLWGVSERFRTEKTRYERQLLQQQMEQPRDRELKQTKETKNGMARKSKTSGSLRDERRHETWTKSYVGMFFVGFESGTVTEISCWKARTNLIDNEDGHHGDLLHHGNSPNVWEYEYTVERKFRMHTGEVTSLCFLPNDEGLLSAGCDGTIWRYNNNEKTFDGTNCHRCIKIECFDSKDDDDDDDDDDESTDRNDKTLPTKMFDSGDPAKPVLGVSTALHMGEVFIATVETQYLCLWHRASSTCLDDNDDDDNNNNDNDEEDGSTNGSEERAGSGQRQRTNTTRRRTPLGWCHKYTRINSTGGFTCVCSWQSRYGDFFLFAGDNVGMVHVYRLDDLLEMEHVASIKEYQWSTQNKRSGTVPAISRPVENVQVMGRFLFVCAGRHVYLFDLPGRHTQTVECTGRLPKIASPLHKTAIMSIELCHSRQCLTAMARDGGTVEWSYETRITNRTFGSSLVSTRKRIGGQKAASKRARLQNTPIKPTAEIKRGVASASASLAQTTTAATAAATAATSVSLAQPTTATAAASTTAPIKKEI